MGDCIRREKKETKEVLNRKKVGMFTDRGKRAKAKKLEEVIERVHAKMKRKAWDPIEVVADMPCMRNPNFRILGTISKRELEDGTWSWWYYVTTKTKNRMKVFRDTYAKYLRGEATGEAVMLASLAKKADGEEQGRERIFFKGKGMGLTQRKSPPLVVSHMSYLLNSKTFRDFHKNRL